MKSNPAPSPFPVNGPTLRTRPRKANRSGSPSSKFSASPTSASPASNTPSRNSAANSGYIDLFWKGVLLVEHKSRGKDLDRAFTQALDYFPGIKERDLPRYVVVSRLRPLPAVRPRRPATRARIRARRSCTRTSGCSASSPATRPAGDRARRDPVNIKAAEKHGQAARPC